MIPRFFRRWLSKLRLEPAIGSGNGHAHRMSRANDVTAEEVKKKHRSRVALLEQRLEELAAARQEH